MSRAGKIEPDGNDSGRKQYVLLDLTVTFTKEMLMSLREPRRNNRKLISQHGQGMLEYALIVFLIAVVAVLGIVFLTPVILNGIRAVLPGL